MRPPVPIPPTKDGWQYYLTEDDYPLCREFIERLEVVDPVKRNIGYVTFIKRKVIPTVVRLSENDKAPQLKLSDDNLQVTGEKGYSMARATHGVNRGKWYFEVTIDSMPVGTAARIGWGQRYANLQASLGYDEFGYSWRSRFGTKFHRAHGKTYDKDGGYTQGDTIGCMIYLPYRGRKPVEYDKSESPSKSSDKQSTADKQGNQEKQSSPEKRNLSDIVVDDEDDDLEDDEITRGQHLPPSIKNMGYLTNVKKTTTGGFRILEENVAVPKLGEKDVLKKSKIWFYKNGKLIDTAFENIYDGTYYPTISLYKNCSVSINFGPNFKHPPDDATNDPDKVYIGFKDFQQVPEIDIIDNLFTDIIHMLDQEKAIEAEMKRCIEYAKSSVSTKN